MTKILLVRHGHVAGIEPERFRGRQPLELTDRGRAEADALARRIAAAWRPIRIYTSPMGRCVATGDAIAQACGAEAEILDDLNDIDYGAWQFRTYAEVRDENPDLFTAWSRRRIWSVFRMANHSRTSWREQRTHCGSF